MGQPFHSLLVSKSQTGLKSCHTSAVVLEIIKMPSADTVPIGHGRHHLSSYWNFSCETFGPHRCLFFWRNTPRPASSPLSMWWKVREAGVSQKSHDLAIPRTLPTDASLGSPNAVAERTHTCTFLQASALAARHSKSSLEPSTPWLCLFAICVPRDHVAYASLQGSSTGSWGQKGSS